MVITLTTQVATSLARVLWTLHWADWAEEQGVKFPAQTELTDAAPDTPPEYLNIAFYAIGHLEAANRNSLLMLVREAAKADGKSLDNMGCFSDEFLHDFGSCLAFMMSGTGVSWFDDHEPFNFVVPPVLEHDSIFCCLESDPEIPEYLQQTINS